MFERDSSGNTRLRIFYCDPMQSSQKPHVENNHNCIQNIIPNGFPLSDLTRADIDLMFSHINSVPRLSLCDKTPYEMFCFLHGKKAAKLLNIAAVARDEVVLKPHLIEYTTHDLKHLPMRYNELAYVVTVQQHLVGNTYLRFCL
jgi:hypothetical protein